jgi:hypothetical protein
MLDEPIRADCSTRFKENIREYQREYKAVAADWQRMQLPAHVSDTSAQIETSSYNHPTCADTSQLD